MDLAKALGQFETTEANLVRAEQTWAQMAEILGDGRTFLGASPEATKYAGLSRDLRDLVESLPALDGWTPVLEIPDPNEMAQWHLDAHDIGEMSLLVSLGEALIQPADALADYRRRLDRTRRRLVRARVLEVLEEVDRTLAALSERVPRDGRSVAEDPQWIELRNQIAEAERLVGTSVNRRGRWSDLRRHMGFAQGGDLHDIAEFDWPTVRADLEAALYGEREPLPVEVADLGSLADQAPSGRVSTALNWTVLKADGFERLIFELIAGTAGYENVQWLMHTNAPDRARDLSADRVITDPLTGTHRQRVIVQCKHWLSRSVAPGDVGEALTLMKSWDSPPVDVLVIATTGRFTADAVTLIEKHNQEGVRPRVEQWPESHLELLLTERPELVSAHGLRDS